MRSGRLSGARTTGKTPKIFCIPLTLKLERYQESHEVECAIGFLTQAALNIRIDTHRRDDFLRNHMLESSLCFDRPAPLQDKVIEDRSRLARLKEGLDKLPRPNPRDHPALSRGRA
jgi:hypothetical protein